MSRGTLVIPEEIAKDMIANGVPMKIITDEELNEEQKAILYGEQLMGMFQIPKYKRMGYGQVGYRVDNEHKRNTADDDGK